MRTAGEPCSDIALESKLELKNWVPWLTVRMKNCASHPIRRNVRERNGIVLIRDASGSHVPRYGDKPCGLQGGTYSGGRELSPGEAAADGACDLSDEYHLCPGHRYTVLAAVTFDHGEPQDQGNLLVVAKPMSFTAPEPYIRFDRPPESMEATVASDPPHRLWLTPEEQWRSQSRFAGKQFGGLILESLAGKGADLKVALRNTTNERMLLARWNSESKYEILVRDAAGRLVPVTEKGKSFFGSGKILDFQILKPREAIEASFPIGELFDMRFPGDYTILASVPVIGDVDAVLTAAPVKVRIEPEPPAPKK
jgi:hypothetical protein